MESSADIQHSPMPGDARHRAFEARPDETQTPARRTDEQSWSKQQAPGESRSRPAMSASKHPTSDSCALIQALELHSPFYEHLRAPGPRTGERRKNLDECRIILSVSCSIENQIRPIMG